VGKKLTIHWMTSDYVLLVVWGVLHFVFEFCTICEYFQLRALVNMLYCSYCCFVLQCSRKCCVWDETSSCIVAVLMALNALQ